VQACSQQASSLPSPRQPDAAPSSTRSVRPVRAKLTLLGTGHNPIQVVCVAVAGDRLTISGVGGGCVCWSGRRGCCGALQSTTSAIACRPRPRQGMVPTPPQSGAWQPSQPAQACHDSP
jgi:hypothetical protein